MPATSKTMALGLFGWTISMLWLGIDSPALADDCGQRILKFNELLQLPGAVLEDCMRTGYVQAIVTAILGSIGGLWIARSLFSQLKQPAATLELPAVSRSALITLVDQIEESATKQGYHEGLKERIGPALDEVQSEINRLARMDPKSEEAKLLKIRLSALLWGLNQTLDPKNTYKRDVSSPALPNSVSAFPGGEKYYKCNKFVADCYSFGAGIGLSLKNGQTGYPAEPDGRFVWPPQANEVARPKANLRNLTDARDYNPAGTPAVDPRSFTRPGDIVAFPARTGSGHATIYVGNGVVIAAKTVEGATFEALEAEQEGHDDTARVRHYTGAGR